MAEKLKSILKRIHWSLPPKSNRGLILRSVIFAVAWLILPRWLFLIIALYCYFIPLFRSEKLLVPFSCLLVLTIVQNPNFLFALVFGIVFYYILLVKDLLIINRRSAYETLVLTLSFFLLRDFFMGSSGFYSYSLFWAFWCAVAIGLLMHSMMRFFAADISPLVSSSAPVRGGSSLGGKADDPRFQSFPQNPLVALPAGGLLVISSWLITLLSWQCILVGLFLPLNFIYQSIIVFIAVTFFYELIAGYFWNDLSRERIFVTASVFFSLLVILLASATWKI